MRRLLAVLTLGALAVFPLAAQRLWTAEIGVRGGWVRFKPSGTAAADQTDLADLPGFSSGYGSLFAVVPVTGGLAIEPSLGLIQFSVLEPTVSLFVSRTNVDLGLRANFAFTPQVYGAVGPALLYSESGGQHDTQVGLQAALGFRTALSPRLRARIEAMVISYPRGARNLLIPANVYGLLFGLSASPLRAAARSGADDFWNPAIGLAAGYTRSHLSGLGLAVDFTQFAAPGSGASAGFPTPPALFVILPLGGRVALEPGFDLHRTQSGGTTTFVGLLSARVDVAVGKLWYAAAGPAVQVNQSTGGKAFGVAGFGVAWGSRFHLAGDLDGRVELNYTTFKERSGLPFATNTLGVMFGAMLPLH